MSQLKLDRYTLLTGAPPFETMSLKDTYNKIRRNDYEIPSRISSAARVLIRKLLQPDPTSRPTMEQVLADEFLAAGWLENFPFCLTPHLSIHVLNDTHPNRYSAPSDALVSF